MAQQYDYDLAVIGSGPAGQRAAIQAAKLGRRVIVIERHDVVGGVCINTGTIPSKTLREAVLMHSVARLVLHPGIPNIQTSWVKMGPHGAALCLEAGANDLGGTLMNESISRAAGTEHGQEFAPERMENLIRGIGRVPQQRTTAYGVPSQERVAMSFEAAELAPVIQNAPRKRAAAE